MKTTIAATTLLFSLTAAAGEHCPTAIPQEMPALPDGSVASEEAMHEAETAYREYVSTIERYLECRAILLTDMSHNRLLDKAIWAAASYNRELRRYVERQGLVAQN